MALNCPLGKKDTHACWECPHGISRYNFNGDTVYDCHHPVFKVPDTEPATTGLREEVRTDCFGNKELAEERGWYRKFFYCNECGLEIKHETWDGQKNHMFGNSTVLKDNQTPNFCPNCGTRTEGEETI